MNDFSFTLLEGLHPSLMIFLLHSCLVVHKRTIEWSLCQINFEDLSYLSGNIPGQIKVWHLYKSFGFGLKCHTNARIFSRPQLERESTWVHINCSSGFSGSISTHVGQFSSGSYKTMHYHVTKAFSMFVSFAKSFSGQQLKSIRFLLIDVAANWLNLLVNIIMIFSHNEVVEKWWSPTV